jgi:hypothetical protein
VWTAAALALIIMWSVLAVWYFIIFFLFGIFVIPCRLMRRSQRKNLHVQTTALATQQAMFQQMTAQQQTSVRQQGSNRPTSVPTLPPSAPLANPQISPPAG